jgi:hypothetical protein
MVDKFQNSRLELMFALEFDRATLDRINWENRILIDPFEIATKKQVHPAAQ